MQRLKLRHHALVDAQPTRSVYQQDVEEVAFCVIYRIAGDFNWFLIAERGEPFNSGLLGQES